MIQNPFILICILLIIESLVLYLAGHDRFKKYFKFLPSVFWIYFLPMLVSTAGLIDSASPIYKTIISNLLPASLFLLLIAVDIKAIMRLGKPALIMMLAGSFGIMLGAPIIFFFFKGWIGAESWSGIGALSASWMGGSANMIAVKEAIGTPDDVFLPMVIVDTIVPYVWMGVLVALVSLEPLFDRWNKADQGILDDLSKRVEQMSSQQSNKWQLKFIILILGAGGLASFFSQWLANYLPIIKDVISTYAWTIIIVSVLGITLSFTKTRRLDQFGSTKVGYFMLYLVLTCIGAKANLASLGSTFLLILAGFLIVLIHALVMVATARVIKAPLFLVAVASQANMGGVASAPIVAEVYRPGLASVGLLMAILGNVCGTYFGILTAQICHLLS